MYQASPPASAGCVSMPWQEADGVAAPQPDHPDGMRLLAHLAQALGPVPMLLLLERGDSVFPLAGTLRTPANDLAPPREDAEGTALCCTAPVNGEDRLLLQLFPGLPVDQGRLAAARPFIELVLRTFAAGLAARNQADRRIAGLESALDQSIYGIMLLRSDGTLLFANQTAGRLLDASDGLRRAGRTISASDLGDAVKLQVAIDHVCRGDARHGEHPVVALRRRNGRRPLLLCVSPASGRDQAGCEASAVLRVFDPECRIAPLIEPVCAHYRLSAVESRLACFIATGLTLEETAAQLRIKEQTARSYLKQIFLKTETNRQAELVRLLISSAVRTLSTGRLRFL